MTEWKLHTPDESNQILEYKCGLLAGQHVRLKRDLEIATNSGESTGTVHPAGEIWKVLPGITTDPVLWFRCPDGSRHTWDDDNESVTEWFEIAEEPTSVEPVTDKSAEVADNKPFGQ